MKGVLILTERRSGSEWLGSLVSSTGRLGTSGEWFANYSWGPRGRSFTADAFFAAALERASTPNGFFCIKLFPAHLHWFQIRHGIDIIHRLMQTHDIRFLTLRRENRLRQAISYARAQQSEQWRADKAKKREPVYDFAQICRCYFLIGASYAYWDSYLGIRDIAAHRFVYEELVPDPMPFLRCIADHAGVGDLPPAEAGTRVQSDASTEDWAARFREDVARHGVVAASAPSRPAQRSPSNLIRLAQGRPLKPYPYAY